MDYVTPLVFRTELGRRLTIEEHESNLTALRTTADFAYNGLATKASAEQVALDIATAKSALLGTASANADTLGKLEAMIGGLQDIITTDDINLATAQAWIDQIKSDTNLIDTLTTDRVTGTQVAQDIDAAMALILDNAPVEANSLNKLYQLLQAAKAGAVASAGKLTQARSLSLTGDVTGTVTTDFSAGASIPVTIPPTGAQAGSYGDNLHVPIFTVNAKGQITQVTQVAVATPAVTIRLVGDIVGTGESGINLPVELQPGVVERVLGFTPENVANKATDFGAIDQSHYPTTQAVNTFVANAVNHINETIAGITGGNAGDLSLSGLKSQIDALNALLATDDLNLDTAAEWIAAIKNDEGLITGLTVTKADKTQVTLDIAAAINSLRSEIDGNVPTAGNTLEKLYTLIQTLNSNKADKSQVAMDIATAITNYNATLAPSANVDTTNADNIISGTLSASRLPASGVQPGTIGASNKIPVITFDQKGRATNISEFEVDVVTWLGYTPANSAVKINGQTLTGNVNLSAADVGLGNVNNTNDLAKPVSTAQAEADAVILAQAKTYAEALVTGLWDDRGNYDASVNTFPVAGGSGAAGAILKGDVWTVSVAGTVGGTPVAVRQTLRAMVDNPGQTAANWAIGLANTDIDDSITAGVTGRAPSQNAVKQALDAEVTARNAAIAATSTGVNTGDETATTIKSKLGITTLSGANTGDETAGSIKTKLGITTLTGDNTGDETNASIKTKLGADYQAPIGTISGLVKGNGANQLTAATATDLVALLNNVVLDMGAL